MAVHLQALCGHVEQPGLRHPSPGIDGKLDLAVCHHRGIGNFDDQIDVLRLRVSGAGVAVLHQAGALNLQCAGAEDSVLRQSPLSQAVRKRGH